MSIDLQAVSKKFGKFTALDQINLQISGGELTALLGPSGCGKTTLLRIIAGLEALDAGRIIFQGKDQTAENPRKRKVGFVFQHYALFRRMNVYDNVAFGLKVQQRRLHLTNETIAAKVNQYLQLVQMEKFIRHYPAQLSGGQRQRVALARALAVEPQVLLLDEPFSALDSGVRKELRRWLRDLHDRIQLTSILVTHDQEEAMEVSDRVVVMNEGRIEQVGTPAAVYDHPANAFVFQFLGCSNILRAEFSDGAARIGKAEFPLAMNCDRSGGPLWGYFRPHDIRILRVQQDSATIPAVVKHIQTVGPRVDTELIRSDTGEMMIAEGNRDDYRNLMLAEGENVFIKIRNVRFFDQKAN
jgi:sulfate transport system ATP-binding protein